MPVTIGGKFGLHNMDSITCKVASMSLATNKRTLYNKVATFND
jgi:hypothetical protein